MSRSSRKVSSPMRNRNPSLSTLKTSTSSSSFNRSPTPGSARKSNSSLLINEPQTSTSPNRKQSDMLNSSKSTECRELEYGFERVLGENLTALRIILLKYEAFKANQNIRNDFLQLRAQESIVQDTAKLVTKLSQLGGPSPVHRVSAFAQLAAQLTAQVEQSIFTEERTTLHAAVQEHEEKKAEANKLYLAASKEIASQKQVIAQLNTKISDLEAANNLITRSHQVAQRELEIAARNQSQTSQFCVELRMQGLDFKAEVERRTAKMLSSIETRLGFIPACVQKHALQLRMLKPPGDPQYDEVRAGSHLHSKIKKSKKSKAKSKKYTTDENVTSQDPAEDSSFAPWESSVLKKKDSAKSALMSSLNTSIASSIDATNSVIRNSSSPHQIEQSLQQEVNPNRSLSSLVGISVCNSRISDSETDASSSATESEIIIEDEEDDVDSLNQDRQPTQSTRIDGIAMRGNDSMSSSMISTNSELRRKPLETNDDWIHWALQDANIPGWKL